MCNAGTTFARNWIGNYESTSDEGQHYQLTQQAVENSPEWFSEVKPERIEVGDLIWQNVDDKGSARWSFIVRHHIYPEDRTAIKEAIERVLNGEDKGDLIGLLRDAVSETWGSDSIDKTQAAFEAFLHKRGLMTPTAHVNRFVTNVLMKYCWGKVF